MALRRAALIGTVLVAILFGAVVLNNSSGYQLQPTAVTELNSVSAQLDTNTKQLNTINGRIQTIQQAIGELQKHLQDDLNAYHQILSKAGE